MANATANRTQKLLVMRLVGGNTFSVVQRDTLRTLAVVNQVNTFTGNVILTRGTLVMRAHKLVVSQDPAGYQFATLLAPPGGLATFRQKRDAGPNQWIEGQAERIEYDGKSEIVKLFSKAKMRRLEGTKPTDEVEGEFISYDSRAEFFTVNNTATGVNKPGGGRIKATIQPRSESKDK